MLMCFLCLGITYTNAQEIVCDAVGQVALDPATCDASIEPADLVNNPGDFPNLATFTVE